MSTEPTDPLTRTLESIADRTPIAPGAAAPGSGLAVLAAVAEGFRIARAEEERPAGAERWGSLELRETLGRGSFGEVRVAWDPALQREVALKLRHPEVGVLRWLDEARSLARVRHPNVVTVYGADLRDGRAGIWMERIAGGTLEDLLAAKGPLPVADATRIGLQLSSALEAVHAAGLVHGDVKAANVMWSAEDPDGRGGRAVLMDFGAVHDAGDGDPLGGLVASGTPLVSPPEVLEGAGPHPGADVYALGVLLHRMLTGRYPVEAATLAGLREAHRRPRLASPLSVRRDVPEALAQLIGRALEPDPARRTLTARELHAALRDLAEPRRGPRSRWVLAGVAVALLSLVALSVPWLSRPTADLRLRTSPLPAAHDSARAVRAWVVEGANAEAELGWHAAPLGDLDGDGFGDLAVTEVWYRGTVDGQGRVRLLFGSPSGLREDPTRDLVGFGTASAFGTYVVSAGDVDGDGRRDLLVSARNERGPAGEIGAVHLYRGDGRAVGRDPAWTYRGTPGHSWALGSGLAGDLDIDGDGYDDIVVGESNNSTDHPDEGCVRVFRGGPRGLEARPSWTLRGGREDALLGWRCESAGDVDRDGFDDVLLSLRDWSGRQPNAGQVRLYRGGRAGLARTASWTWEGAGDLSHAGSSIGAGDVDGDGYSDVVVGESGYSSDGLLFRGRVLLFRGGPGGLAPRPSWEWRGPSTTALLGGGPFALDDLDGDGCADLVVGAFSCASPGPPHRPVGLVVMFRGSSQGFARDPLWWRWGTESGTSYGVLAAPVGDLDGDGLREFAVGAPYGGPQRAGLLEIYRLRPPGR